MTRPILVFVFFMLFVTEVESQPPLAWAGQLDYKNSPHGYDVVNAVDVDKTGSMFITGKFGDTLDTDPSVGTFYLTPDHSVGAGFIIKFSSTGKLIWAKKIKVIGGVGTANINVTTIKVDSLGNVYVGGEFWGAVDFDPGPAVFSLNAYDDGFLMKLDPSGNFLWAKQFVTTPGSNTDPKQTVVREITFDSNLNPCLVGNYRNGSVDMDPGPNKFFLQSKGIYNVFVTKLNSNGDFKWAKSFDGIPFVHDIKCDKYQHIFFCGSTGSGIDLDPGNPVVSPKGTAGYLCKLDSGGNFIKALFFEGNCFVSSVVISDKILIAGHATTVTDLDPGSNVYLVNPSNGSSGFFASLDTLDNFVWAKEIAGAGPQFSGNNISNSDIQINAKKEIYLSSVFTGTYDFDAGSATYTLNAGSLVNNQSTALSSYDQQGNFLWATQLPDEYWSFDHSPARVTPDGDIYSAGLFSGIWDFDPDVTTFYMTPLNSSAIGIRKLSLCKSPPSITLNSDKTQICKGEEIWLTASGGESYTWNHNFQPLPVVVTAPQTNMYIQVIGKDNMGCKSSAEVLITVNECTSIKELENDLQSFYPNPTEGILFLTNPLRGEIKITDATGRLAKEISVVTEERSIDLSELPAGIYLVDYCNNNNEHVRSKIVRK